MSTRKEKLITWGIVGEYYDDNTDDITFWWESKNKHWSK